MSQKQSNQNQIDIADFVEKKRVLKEKIKSQKYAVSRISNGQQEGIEARQAETRLDSFIQRYGHEPSAVSSPNEASKYKALKADVEKKRMLSKSVNAVYRENMAELKKLNDGLNAMRLPLSHDDFSIKGFSQYIEKAVAPFKEAIEQIKQKLDRLQNRRDELSAQLRSIKTRPKPLDDDSLVNVSVDNHFDRQSKLSELQAKKDSIEDLISQLDRAIAHQQKLLEKTKIEFADNYTIAANNYTELGIKAVAKALHKILQDQKDYMNVVEQTSRRIIQENGINQQHIFGPTGVTPEVMKNLFGSRPRMASEIQYLVDTALG